MCPTRNQPDGIGFWKNSPAANCRSKRVGRIRLQRVCERVGRSQRSEKTAKKRRGNCEKRSEKPRSGGNLTEFDEISLDSLKISSDLREIEPESGFFGRDLGFLSPKFGFLSSESGFFAGLWVFADRFRFFGFLGREIETDPLESVFGGENPPPTAGVSRVGRFRIGFGRVSGWVGSPDMFGQP